MPGEQQDDALRRHPHPEQRHVTPFKGCEYHLPKEEVYGDEGHSVFSTLYFTWVTKFVEVARREAVSVDDLPRTTIDLRCHNFTRLLSDRFRSMLAKRDMWNNKVGWFVEYRRPSVVIRAVTSQQKGTASPLDGSRGRLKSVGYFPQFGGSSGPLMAEVEWPASQFQPLTDTTGASPGKPRGQVNEPLLSGSATASAATTPVSYKSGNGTNPSPVAACKQMRPLTPVERHVLFGAASPFAEGAVEFLTLFVPPSQLRLVADALGAPTFEGMGHPPTTKNKPDDCNVSAFSVGEDTETFRSGILNSVRSTSATADDRRVSTPDKQLLSSPDCGGAGEDTSSHGAYPVKPNLGWALISATVPQLVRQMAPRFIADMSSLASPLILQQLIKFLNGEDGDLPLWRGLVLTAALLGASVLYSLAAHQHFYLCMRAGVVARGAMTGAVIEKLFTISGREKALPANGSGRVLTMVSSDCQRAEEIEWYLMYLWSNPILLVVAVAELYYFVGWPSLIAVCICLLLVPVQAILTRLQQSTYVSQLSVTDRRLRATNELFSGIHVVKSMGWEGKFVQRILELRKEELASLRRIHLYRSLSSFLNTSTPILIIVVVLVSYELLGNALTTTVVFPTIAMLSVLRTPFIVFPMTLSSLASFMASARRVQTFLESSDEQDRRGDIGDRFEGRSDESHVADSNYAVVVKGVSAVAYTPVGPDRPAANETSPTPDYGGVDKKGSSSPSKGTAPNKTNDSDSTNVVLERQVILKDIGLTIPRGKLSIIVGPTGSGKSTLLGLIAGQVDFTVAPSEGAAPCGVWCDKDIAMVSQASWIMNASVRGNILMYTPEADVDESRLDAALDSCQLRLDLATMPNGLETEIGEKGVNLSGGQKARVALARAVYANKRLYLLDDPISALDAHVGETIVEGCILGQLAHTTRILATHHVHLVSKADGCVVVVEGGMVTQYESAAEYLSSPHYEMHQRTLSHDNGHATDVIEEEPAGDDGLVYPPLHNDIGEQAASHYDGREAVMAPNTAGVPIPPLQPSSPTKSASTLGDDGVSSLSSSAPTSQPSTNLIEVEDKPMGSVPWAMYATYAAAWGGIPMMIVVVAMMLVTECMSVSSILWITLWTDRTFPSLTRETNLYIYVGCAVASMIVPLVRWLSLYAMMRRASYGMFKDLLRSVAIAPIAFFHANPLGRIMNRFSRDIDVLDQDLQLTVASVLTTVAPLLSSIAMMIGTLPFVAVAVAISCVLYYILLVYFNKAYREIRRVSSILKSPMFSIISESLSGSQTIRAFQCSQYIFNEALWRCDRSLLASNIQWALSRWLGTRLESVTSVGIALIALIAVLCKHYDVGQQSVGLMALSITLGMSLLSSLNYTIRNISKLEADMNTVERIVEYTTSIAHEDIPKEHLKQVLPPVAPQIADSSITLTNVMLSYRPGLKPALNRLSFRVLPGEKVGIVGRTGSGKSTLILALLRMVEISGGDIFVGDRSIRDFTLVGLRSLFSMVPQDPLLFEGTVRSNLDPFNEFEGKEGVIWHALEQVGLREVIAQDPNGIDKRLVEGGTNFSTGQRQLLCLGRALLKPRSRFVLMDEATANIDTESDKLIQRTIRRAFSAHTVITIAHRLHTILDYDKVVVIDAGSVIETGAPSQLAADTSSAFYGMLARQKQH